MGEARNLDLAFNPQRRIFEADFDLEEKVVPLTDAMPAASAAEVPSEDLTEHAEEFAEIREGGRVETRPSFDAGVAHRVVAVALVLVAEHRVGLGGLLEALSGIRLFARVGVIAPGENPVGLLQGSAVALAIDPQDLVVVALAHDGCPTPRGELSGRGLRFRSRVTSGVSLGENSGAARGGARRA